MLISRKKTIAGQQVDNPYWMSFSDMMSGLLIIFILVCMALLYQLINLKNEFTHKISEDSTARKELLEEIKGNLEKQGITVYITDNETVLRIPENTLHFASNEYVINDELKINAWRIGQAILDAITKDSRWKHLDTIFVEGHTDSSLDPNADKMHNWNFSVRRAISLWQYWLYDTNYGNIMAELHNKAGEPLISVSGYADSRRVEENELDDETKKKNRRIDIRFTTRQPTIMELE